MGLELEAEEEATEERARAFGIRQGPKEGWLSYWQRVKDAREDAFKSEPRTHCAICGHRVPGVLVRREGRILGEPSPTRVFAFCDADCVTKFVDRMANWGEIRSEN